MAAVFAPVGQRQAGLNEECEDGQYGRIPTDLELLGCSPAPGKHKKSRAVTF